MAVVRIIPHQFDPPIQYGSNPLDDDSVLKVPTDHQVAYMKRPPVARKVGNEDVVPSARVGSIEAPLTR